MSESLWKLARASIRKNKRMEQKFPIPAAGQNPMEFIQQQIQDVAKQKLQAKIVEMRKDFAIERVGNNLYIMDTIYDVWPDDENKGKTARQIGEIYQDKLQNYSRIHDEYIYENGEFQYFPGGLMKFVIHFIKK